MEFDGQNQGSHRQTMQIFAMDFDQTKQAIQDGDGQAQGGQAKVEAAAQHQYPMDLAIALRYRRANGL